MYYIYGISGPSLLWAARSRGRSRSCPGHLGPRPPIYNTEHAQFVFWDGRQLMCLHEVDKLYVLVNDRRYTLLGMALHYVMAIFYVTIAISGCLRTRTPI